ncbi:hypothetical protein DL95DRAFT_388257 [Leptodontidium sp. 2 PMI_412]|nr:hypothetical protein DL95DRAFT_388257 [Leptodontidium sp. 2 PMI_412]
MDTAPLHYLFFAQLFPLLTLHTTSFLLFLPLLEFLFCTLWYAPGPNGSKYHATSHVIRGLATRLREA